MEKEPLTAARRKDTIKQVAVYALAIAVVGILIWYVLNNREMIAQAAAMPKRFLLLSFLIYCVAMVTDSVYLKIAASTIPVQMDATDWLGISAVAGVIGLVVPFRSSTVIKGVYFKKKCGMDYTKFVSLVAAGFIFSCVCTMVQIWLGLLLMSLRDTQSQRIGLYTCLFTALMIGGLYLLIYKQTFIKKYLPFKKVLLPAYQGFLDLFENKKAVLQCFLVTLATTILGSGVYFTLARGLGMPVSFGMALLYNGIMVPLNLLSILPNNIGGQEAILGWLLTLTGSAFSEGVLLSLMVRLVLAARYFAFSLVFAIPVIRRLRGGKKPDEAVKEEQTLC